MAISRWSGRKIALAVLCTIAAIASVVGNVFLLMMLTKKKEEASLEGETTSSQLSGEKEEEEIVQTELTLSREEKTEKRKTHPLSSGVSRQANPILTALLVRCLSPSYAPCHCFSTHSLFTALLFFK